MAGDCLAGYFKSMLLSTIAVAMHSQVHAHRAISRMLTVIVAVSWRSNVRMYRTTTRDLKTKYDPTNLFRLNANVPPAQT